VVMEMKRIRRTFVILIAVGIIVSLTMVLPASAQTGKGNVRVLDSEFVLCTMKSTGEVEEIQVFDWLSLDGDGTVNVREKAAFDDVGGYQGVKSFTKPSVEDGYIVWPEMNVDGPANVIATTKLSETDVEEARTRIPLDASFKYWFDEKPLTDLSTITGKEGHFKMELTLTNTSAEETEIEYEDALTGEMVTEEVDTYLPLVILPYDWYFDNSIFFNLEADPTGLVVYMPDMYNVGWSIPLFPPATEESHTIWVEADVKNFQMPPLTLAVAFVFPETNQVDALEQLGPAALMIYEGMVQVAEGIGTPETEDTLLYGITAVDDGVTQLAAGLPEASSNINSQMIPGVNQMVAGIGSPSTPDTLLYADTAVIGGLQGMSAGIGSATSKDTLLYALDQMAAGLNTTLGYIGSSSTPNTLLYAANAIIGGLDNPSGVPQPGLLQGLTNIQLNTNPTTGPVMTNLTNIVNLGNLLKATYPQFNPPYPPNDPTVDNIIAIAQGLQAAICTAPYPNSIYSGATAMIAGIGSASTPNTLLYGATAIYGGLAGIAAGIGSATTPDTLLYAVDQITQGLNAMKAGIGSSTSGDTLLYAMAQMQNGLYQLKSGLSTGSMSNPGIKEGLMLISSGIEEAVAGLGSPSTPDTLLYGTSQINSGLTELGGGATQLEEGMATLISTLNMTDAELEIIHERGEEFDHFLGRAEGEENNVRFVYQSKPTYNYESGSSTSWIVAIVLSILIALGLVAGGILLSRRGEA